MAFGCHLILTKEKNPLVSVIIPYYNSKEFVNIALNSIFDQSYRPIEIIVIDDCSEIPFCLSGLNDELNVKIIRNLQNFGAGKSRIIGIQNARGRFISFLDCDDIWVPDKLSLQIHYMLDNSLSMSWTGYIFADEMLKYKGSYMPNNASSYLSFITKFFTIGCLTCVYDRKYLTDPSNANLKMRNDYQMWYFLYSQIKNNPNIIASPIRSVTAIHRLHDSSLTANKIKAAFFWWKYLGITNHTFLFRSFCFICYFIFTLKLRLFKQKDLTNEKDLNKVSNYIQKYV